MRNTLLIGSGISGVVLAVLLLQGTSLNSGIANAQQPQILSGEPIGTENVLKIKAVDVKDKKLAKNDVDLTVEQAGDLKLNITAVNKLNKENDIVADEWKVSIRGAILSIDAEDFSVVDTKLSKDAKKQLKEIDLSQWISKFTHYPGRYTVLVSGYNYDYAIAKAQELDAQGIEYETNELAMYKIEAQIVIGFDEAKIKTNGYLLESENAQIAIDGPNQFEVTDDSRRNVVVLLTNTNDFPISSMVHDKSFTVWSGEDTRAEGYEGITEWADVCQVLQPGESTQIASFYLDKSKYPLGENGLSEKLNNGKVAKIGTYVFGINGSTLPCTVDGQEIPGVEFNARVVFEVK